MGGLMGVPALEWSAAGFVTQLNTLKAVIHAIHPAHIFALLNVPILIALILRTR